jgi:hypothetical protein
MSDATRSTPDSSFSESKFVEELYDTNNYSDEWIHNNYEEFRYHGFDRNQILRLLSNKFNDNELVAKIIIICAIKGPVRASTTSINNRTLSSMGIPARRKPGEEGLSCGRVTAATADIAAYFLKKVNAPKRIDCECPGWLQFPAAGSIKMPERYRNMHEEFSKQFSTVIGGSFKYEIYQQMVANAYIDEGLKLF